MWTKRFQIIHDPDEKVPSVGDEKIMMFGDLFHQNAELVSHTKAHL